MIQPENGIQLIDDIYLNLLNYVKGSDDTLKMTNIYMIDLLKTSEFIEACNFGLSGIEHVFNSI